MSNPSSGALLIRFLLCGLAGLSLLAASPGRSYAQTGDDDLSVRIVDGRISLRAMAVPLEELLDKLDRAAGTQSTVADELIGRNVSVAFQGLVLGDAVVKIFEGLDLDYIVVGGRKIMVTAVSGVPSASSQAGFMSPVSPTVSNVMADQSPPVAPPTNPFQVPGEPPAQPAIIQTPFGPLVNPRANPNGAAVPPPGPLSMPGQGGQPNDSIGNPTASPTPGQPSIFGNTSPPILDLNKQQPQAQPPLPGVTPGIPSSPFPQSSPTPRP
jgi:hypothetical protein